MTAFPHTIQRSIARIQHGTRPVRGVVVHDAEAESIDAVAHYFATSSPDAVGAHAGISGDGRKVVQWAPLESLVYHAKGANAFTVGIELMGYASLPRSAWLSRRRQRKALGNRIAWVCFHYGLGSPRRGANYWGHADFPAGAHSDPGRNFPWKQLGAHACRAYRRLERTDGKSWSAASALRITAAGAISRRRASVAAVAPPPSPEPEHERFELVHA
jgi:N-acetyl-anhydromuramyl-L-alanine amidase AmpD